eukprot:310741_1
MNFFSIMSTSKIPSNGLYKLPGSCLYVHILSDGEQRIILKSSSKTVISEASVPLFVEEYRKIKRDRVTPWHKLYNPFVESNVDQILQDKNWAWSDIHSSNNENNEETPHNDNNNIKTHIEFYKEVHDTFKINAEAYIKKHPLLTIKKKRRKSTKNKTKGKQIEIEQKDQESFNTNNLSYDETSNTTPPSIHGTRSVVKKQLFASKTKQLFTPIACNAPQPLEISIQLNNILQAIGCLNGNVINLSNRMDSMEINLNGRIDKLESLVISKHKQDKFEQSKQIELFQKKQWNKNYYDKSTQNTNSKKLKEYDNCSKRWQKERVKKSDQYMSEQLGTELNGFDDLIKYSSKNETTLFIKVINNELLKNYLTSLQKKLKNAEYGSIEHIYDELFIMIESQTSSTKYKWQKQHREKEREYKFDPKTKRYFVSRPHKKDGAPEIMVDVKKLYDVLTHIYGLDKEYRTELIPRIWSSYKYNDDNTIEKVFYTLFIPPQYQINFIVHLTYTHPTFLNNINDHHSLCYKKWIFEDFIQKNDETHKDIKPEFIINEKIIPDNFEVKGYDIYFDGPTLIVLNQYDVKGMVKNLSDKIINHMEMILCSLIQRGAIGSTLCRWSTVLSNMPDTSDEWIEFVLYWIKLYKQSVVDTIILNESIYKLHIRNKIIFLFGMDLSAAATGYGARKNAQWFLAILVYCAADEYKNANNWEGDFVILEASDGSNREQFEKLFKKGRKMSYKKYKELKENGKLVKNRKYLVYPIPPGYRSKIDDIIDAMRKRHKERGISDEESATLIDNYLFENNIIFYKKGIKQLYEYPLLCAHHTMTGDIRHCVGIEINEKIKLFKVKKDKICIVFDKLNKLDPSLSGQNQRVKDLIKAVKVNSSVSLSFTGDPSKKYESLLAEYHLLFFHTDLELQNYHNDVFFCMNKAVNLVLSYHMRCFIKLMNIYHIDTTHIVFDVLYDKVHEFGCHLQYNARRLFNGKLHKKQYLRFSLSIFAFVLKCIMDELGIGAQIFTNGGTEAKGKEWGDQTAFTDKKPVTQLHPRRVNDNDTKEDIDITELQTNKHNCYDHMWGRMKLLEMARFDNVYANISNNVVRELESEDTMNKLIEQQKIQLETLDYKTADLWELEFFKEFNYFFDWNKMEQKLNIKIPQIFRDCVEYIRTLKIGTALKKDYNDIKTNWKRAVKQKKKTM